MLWHSIRKGDDGMKCEDFSLILAWYSTNWDVEFSSERMVSQLVPDVTSWQMFSPPNWGLTIKSQIVQHDRSQVRGSWRHEMKWQERILWSVGGQVILSSIIKSFPVSGQSSVRLSLLYRPELLSAGDLRNKLIFGKDRICLLLRQGIGNNMIGIIPLATG